MTALDRLPPAAAIAIALMVVAGASLALLGSLGLVRMKSFYQRLHAPPLAASGGVVLIALASMLLFSLLERRAILHEVVIVLFMLVVTPVSMAMLGRAAPAPRSARAPRGPRRRRTSSQRTKLM